MAIDDSWESVKQRLSIGSRVRCVVTQQRNFGVFVRIEGIQFEGLIHITDFKDAGPMSAEEFPALGSELEAVVMIFNDEARKLRLGVKPSQLRRSG